MPVIAKRQRFYGLRRHIEKLEGERGDCGRETRAIACGPARLALGALHEIRAGDYRDQPAAQGLALALAGEIARVTAKPIVWIGQAHEIFSGGRAYGCGLSFFGLGTNDIIFVYPRSAQEILWAAEEAARASGVSVVLVDLFKPHKSLDLTATRRLQLAAEASGATPVLLRSTKDEGPSAARTRWRVGAAPSACDEYDRRASGNPRWGVALERCREGGRGNWVLEWDYAKRTLCEAPPLYGGAVSKMVHRPAQARQAVA